MADVKRPVLMESEIEKLLADDEKEVVETKEEVASTESTTEEKTDELTKLKAENERLRKASKTLNDKLKEKEVPKEEVKVDSEDPLATREGWMNLIKEETSKAVAPLKEAALKRAKDKFVSSHPEYASEQGKEKLRSVLERASALGLTSIVDEGDMVECLLDAWALENRKELEAQSQKLSESRRRTQAATASVTQPSEGSSAMEDDFTEDEREEAAKYGKSPEAYKKALKTLQESSLNTN